MSSQIMGSGASRISTREESGFSGDLRVSRRRAPLSVLGPPTQCWKPFQLAVAQTPCASFHARTRPAFRLPRLDCERQNEVVVGPFAPLDGVFRPFLTHFGAEADGFPGQKGRVRRQFFPARDRTERYAFLRSAKHAGRSDSPRPMK
jgi:hypothetical protein